MSKLGFHCASSHRNGAGLLLDAGAPVVVMVDQNMIGEVHTAGAIAAYRTQKSPLGEDNIPGLFDAPIEQMYTMGDQWMNSLLPIYNLNPGADYYIINNELDPPTPKESEKLNAFYMRCLDIADLYAFKIGICSFSSGNPSDDGGYSLEDRWLPLLPAVKKMTDYGHVIVLHAHCLNSDSMQHSGESESLRHQRTLRYFAANGLHPHVIIGELSNGVGGVQPDLAGYLANVTWWDEVVMASPWRDQIIGGCLYGFNAAETIASAVPDLVTWISEHPTPVTPPPPPPPPVPTGCSPAAFWYRVKRLFR